MTVRRALPGEARVVADVLLRSRHASLPAIPPLVHTDEEVRVWFETVVLPQREVWVVDEPGQGVVAVCVLDGNEIDQLYVDTGQTGRGFGRLLLDHAKRQRPDHLDLWTFQSNTGARRFYERHGFVAVEETDGDNEEGAPDVRYRWTPLA